MYGGTSATCVLSKCGPYGQTPLNLKQQKHDTGIIWLYYEGTVREAFDKTSTLTTFICTMFTSPKLQTVTNCGRVEKETTQSVNYGIQSGVDRKTTIWLYPIHKKCPYFSSPPCYYQPTVLTLMAVTLFFLVQSFPRLLCACFWLDDDLWYLWVFARPLWAPHARMSGCRDFYYNGGTGGKSALKFLLIIRLRAITVQSLQSLRTDANLYFMQVLT